MEQKDIEYFRTLLNNMLEEAQHKGDSTLEDLTDSNELFADPADRASAESDRAFTPRLKARPVTKLCINCKARQEEGENIRGE